MNSLPCQSPRNVRCGLNHTYDFHQQLEAALCERQPILTPPAGFGPLHRDGGPARAGAWRHRMGELGRAVDMIDAELDAMQLPARLDDGDADGLGIDLPV